MSEKKVVLITGANRGIGREVAKQLAEKGCHVFLTARDEVKGQLAVEELVLETGLKTIYFQKLDVLNPASYQVVVRGLVKVFRRLDVLINNAGIFVKSGDTTQVTKAEMQESLETNLYAPMLLSQALLPLLKRSKDGRIINVSSSMGQLTTMKGQHAAYRMSKVALNGLTAIMSADLKEHSIKVVAVDPGWVRSDMGGPTADRSLAEGAAGISWLAVEEDIENGKFYRDGKVGVW